MRITAVVAIYSQSKFYVKVETDDGFFGFGESSPMSPPVLAEIYRRIIRPEALGCDPFRAEELERRILGGHYKMSGNLLAAAYSGFEIALWDLRGRYLGQPCYNLMGGAVREQMPLYGSSMSRHLAANEEAAKVRSAVDRFGFRAVKIKTGPRYGTGQSVDLDADEAKIRAVRSAVGSRIGLMIDGNGSYSVAQAVALVGRVRDVGLLYFEEPCPYSDRAAYRQLAAVLPVPVQVGEQDWDLYAFRDYIGDARVAYYGADPIKCGGLARAKRAAVLCRAFGTAYMPHNTTRSIGWAAGLHLAWSTPDIGPFYEYSIEPGVPHHPAIDTGVTIAEGAAVITSAPGLGVRVDEARLLLDYRAERT